MNCMYHNDREAVCACVECGSLICDACSVKIEGKTICKPCAEKIYIRGKSYTPHHSVRHTHYDRRRSTGDAYSNMFLVFLFSALPGAPQMYMGFMRRGLLIMGSFFLSIAVVANFRAPLIVIFTIPVIWTLSFFDAINVRRKLLSGQKVEDNLNSVKEFIGCHKTVFTILGAYAVIGTIINTLFRSISFFRSGNLLLFAMLSAGIYLVFNNFFRSGHGHKDDEKSRDANFIDKRCDDNENQ